MDQTGFAAKGGWQDRSLRSRQDEKEKPDSAAARFWALPKKTLPASRENSILNYGSLINFLQRFIDSRYTERDSRIGRWQGGALNLG